MVLFCAGPNATLFVAVPEDVAVTTTVTQITAMDADRGLNGILRYDIVSGNEAGCFILDDVTGMKYVWTYVFSGLIIANNFFKYEKNIIFFFC